MANGTTGPVAHTSVVAPVLHTLESIYLRSTMQSESMQTHNYNVGAPKTQEVTHSSIIARVPAVQ
eukprot:1210176-Pleurochrysis_carterae.AAC.1